MFGAWKKTGAFGRIAPAEVKRAGEALSAVGLDGFGRRHAVPRAKHSARI